jgi:hypothetical protein
VKRPFGGLLVVGAAALVGALIAALFLLRSGGDQQALEELSPADPGPVHVHGLGINPADGALLIATHTGLFRVADGARNAERVGESFQDTMGFSVAGPNRFFGSGHPDLNGAREKGLPPHLGLIESRDGGESWDSVSLLGEADFHVLRFSGDRIYGYDASNDRLLAGGNGGTKWRELPKPGPVVDLAVAPLTPGRLLLVSAGASEQGLFESRDGGGSWKQISDAVGLLAWPARDQLYVVSGDGQVFVSADGGRRFERRGEIGGEPAALLAQQADELYVALHDGTIKRSTDGGATWTVRSSP